MGGGVSGAGHGSGKESSKINPDKQAKHNKKSKKYQSGKSYTDMTIDEAQKFVDKYLPKATKISENKFRVKADSIVGTYVDENGNECKTKNAIIVLSKTGSHVYPGQPDDDEKKGK